MMQLNGKSLNIAVGLVTYNYKRIFKKLTFSFKFKFDCCYIIKDVIK